MHLRVWQHGGTAWSERVADDPDSTLVAAAQATPAAFERLVARYDAPLLNYCFYRLGSWEEAEDAAQEVLTRAFQALPRFRADIEGAFRSWLFTIAHHEVSNRRRGIALRASAARVLDDAMADSGPGPEEMAIAADHQGWVLSLLAQLSADQRQVVSFRLAGLTATEIGTVLGRRPGAVRAIQARAMARLRDLLGVRADERETPDV
jgi:RNA polymerase sigma-70 factor (ECF subfamily)